MEQTLDVLEIRLRLGLTQADFALLMGVNQATVSRWETGRSAVSRPVRMALERLQQEAPTKRIARKAVVRLLKQEAA